MSNNIKVNPRIALLAGTILEPEPPTLDSIKDSIFGLCLSDDCGDSEHVIQGLVSAYIALAGKEEEEIILVSDSDDWAAEKVYMEYAIAGYRRAIRNDYPEESKSLDDSDVYERCPWYEFGSMVWPAQLIAEVGFIMGSRAGREAIAMSRYVQQQEASNG